MQYRFFTLCAILALIVATGGCARANIAPPEQPPGSTIGLGAATEVHRLHRSGCNGSALWVYYS